MLGNETYRRLQGPKMGMYVGFSSDMWSPLPRVAVACLILEKLDCIRETVHVNVIIKVGLIISEQSDACGTQMEHDASSISVSTAVRRFISIYMIPARGPQTVCLMQSLFCNHSAIFALQSFAMQSLLFCNLCYAIVAMQSLLCNLCYAIFAMQSLLCNLCYAIFAFLCFLSSDCKKHYKTCTFCNILLKTLKNCWLSFVF